MRIDILMDALLRISNFGNGNPNRPWIRAYHYELIDIANKALDDYVRAGGMVDVYTANG